MTRAIIRACGALLLAGCSHGGDVGSWRDATLGPFTGDDGTALSRVLEGADDTPGNQSLLYVAMTDAESASQSATRAVVFADRPAETASALGDVIYALDPAAAPDWDTRDTGLVPAWNGTGYGLIRTSGEIAATLRGLAGGDAGDATGAALVCVENTSARARRALDLARSILADLEAPGRATMLPQLERLARGLLDGLDTDSDGTIAMAEDECGLRQAEAALDGLVGQPGLAAAPDVLPDGSLRSG